MARNCTDSGVRMKTVENDFIAQTRTTMNTLITHPNTASRLKALLMLIVLITLMTDGNAQTCPSNVETSLTTNPDSYYPGLDSALNAGSTSILLGAAGYGSVSIASGDLLLVIQMQGAQIDATNTTSYGDGISGGGSTGYLSNSELIAGNMEYVTATNAVPLSGGTLTLGAGTINKYRNSGYGMFGQYRYQVIRVGMYYNLTLGGTVSASPWNGSSGGVLVLSVTGTMNFNGQTLSAAGAGFRGGGGRTLGGGSGGFNTDLVTFSSSNYNASKGEGIAGTPRFINNVGVLLDNGSANEGYPGGSYAAGAPGNAGGGGTDGRPSSNDQNSGGGGGGNGGVGGRGGNSWSSNLATGGEPGALFNEKSTSHIVMGGGGGAGTTNNGTGVPALGFASSGAAGGGIIVISATTITGTGTIDVSGASSNTSVVNDGSGGGGAGGSVLINAGSGWSGITVLAKGGTGGSNSGGGSPPPHGPGGGGGGGVVYSNGALNAASSVAAGTSGTTSSANVYGSTAGTSGVLVQNATTQQLPTQYTSCSLLPMMFLSTAANKQQSAIAITWRVTNEVSVSHYAIEKSIDGNNFSTVGTVAFQSHSAGINTYQFIDNKISGAATVYYRIREVDESGSTTLSNIMSVKEEGLGGADASVVPNPVMSSSASIRFTLRSAPGAPITLRLLSVNGAVLWQQQYAASAGLNVVSIGNLSNVPSGMYFLQYYNNQDAVNIKMIVQHG